MRADDDEAIAGFGRGCRNGEWLGIGHGLDEADDGIVVVRPGLGTCGAEPAIVRIEEKVDLLGILGLVLEEAIVPLAAARFEENMGDRQDLSVVEEQGARAKGRGGGRQPT